MEQGNVQRVNLDGIAVIGIAARFPGAEDYHQFWENLKDVTCSIREVPEQRWNADRYYSPVSEDTNKSVSKWGGFIDGVDLFDPMFFGISPREARVMDPQQRIALELAWACIEDAGYSHDALRGSRTGVYLGVMNFDYRERLTEAIGAIAGHTSTGAYTALIPNRISYHFDWQGPSMPIDTACSSSLVALHEAVHALQRGECEQALVGGVSVLCSPTHFVSFSKTGMLSPDGLCRTFDDRANGYVRGEGAGLALLKPLRQAISDGDRIYGVIKGTAVNHGGKARTVTYPNPQAQADVIARAHEHAGFAADSISYIEAHGTGTPKGDPIEISGLKSAFARLAEGSGGAAPAQSCGLGSLKANVGHLEPVAGIAGMIKVLLAMKHRTLPGLAHFQRLNHRIDLSDSPFYIVERTQDWPTRLNAEGEPLARRAGVSSFGFGGVNAHAVIEEFVRPHEASPRPPDPAGAAAMIVLSAKTADRLRPVAQRLLDWLRLPDQQDAVLADIAYTLQVGRTALEHRLALTARSIDELADKLTVWLAGQDSADGLFCGQAGSCTDNPPEPDTLPAGDHPDAILKCWVLGQPIDWKTLYGKHRPNRIGLPTYPFARETYWVNAPDAAAVRSLPTGPADTGPAPAEVPAHAAGLEAMDKALHFEEHWVEQAATVGAGRPIGTVLCFASRSETRQAIKRHFAALGEPVRAVFVADAAAGLKPDGADIETVACAEPQSFVRAFEEVLLRHGKVDAVWYLWPLEDMRFIVNCSPIVFLLQAAGACKLVNGPVLLAAQGGDDESRCHWESWIGFERSAANALANATVAGVYSIQDGQPDTPALAHWVQTLWSELQSPAIESSLYRNGVRHVCRLKLAEGPNAGAGAEEAVLRQGGTYLITGGLGGLGSLFAAHLLGKYAANVVLIGRSPLDPARQHKLDALARAGGTVTYLQADIGDRRGMGRCLATLRQNLGVLNGVIHAAGVESWQGLQNTPWPLFEAVLSPKVAGTLVLDELLRDEPLDFLCHFSSSSAVLGDFGGCSYAVGNRFQMAHARLRQQRGHPGKTLAINWPLWRDGGMQVGDQQSTRAYLASTGQTLLEAADGLATFERLLSWPAPHYLVMVGDHARIRRLLKLDTGARVVPTAPASGTVAPLADPSTSPGELPLAQRIERDLLRLAGELLEVAQDRLALDGNLADFGFDSINLASFATVLTRFYGVEVLPPVFFGYPTLGRLTHYFTEQHGAAMQAFYVDAPPAQPQAACADAVPAAVPGGAADDGMAVIGMSGRFPGARSIDDMWRILVEGRSAIAAAPADREGGWAALGHRCGFVPGVDEFDSLFFEISPREADNMDPQQRLLLEEVWKALEDAGYGPAQLAGRCVGTFVGVEEGGYHRLTQCAGAGEASITSNHNGILAGRIAYFLDLDGPTLAVNAACASGLVALHQACQSLRSGECDMAIVAAANLLPTPHGYRDMDQAGMLSPNGQCHAFDERANGMVPGEAVVAVVLKRIALARRDNDRIHALVAGSGINSSGRTNGITAPSGTAQAALVESVYRRHGIDPDQIGYVIAHGTGTRLGDPVEVNALSQGFRAAGPSNRRAGYCALTSTKPNFGSTLAASGLLSMVGMIEAMRHDTIPASLNAQRPNPFIGWQDSPFFINSRNRHWPRGQGRVRLGAVNSFGMNGCNAHVVVREYVDTTPAPPPEQPSDYLFVLSAKTEKALQRKIADLAAALESVPARLADVCYTLLDRRHHFAHRHAFVAGSAAEAVRILRGADGTPPAGRYQGKAARDFRPQAPQRQAIDALLADCEAAAGHPARLREALCGLASFYCQGYVFSAVALLRGARPRVARLPAYPFAPVRHWVRRPDAAASVPVAAPADASARPDLGTQDKAEGLLVVSVWDPADPAPSVAPPLTPGSLLIVGGTPACLRAALEIDPHMLALQVDDVRHADVLARRIERRGIVEHVVWLVPQSACTPVPGDAAIAAQDLGVLTGFRLIQALLMQGYGQRALNFSVITVRAQSIGAGDSADATHAGVHGLAGALAKAYPNWAVRLVDLPAPDAVPLPEVLSLPAAPHCHAWVRRHGEWYRPQLMPLRVSGKHESPYRDLGVYVVIGGAGEIGAAWSEYMIRHHGARIVWVGRRERDARIDAQLARLAAFGQAPLYVAADARTPDALEAVRATVLARHGEVHGVVHAARDCTHQALDGMTEQQFLSALRAKVDISVRVAQVFGHDPLDFLLFFSSMTSLIKHPRQAHHAAGCVFADAFAGQLRHRVPYPVKVMNCEDWKAQHDASACEHRSREPGAGLVAPIAPEVGMRALDILLGSPLDQLGMVRAASGLEAGDMIAPDTIDLYPAGAQPDPALGDMTLLPAA